MGFENFGVVSHMMESKAEEFVAYLEKGKVMANKCKRCGNVYFPPQTDCPSCLINDMAWIEIADKGKLITYSIVQYGPEGFEDKVPYKVGIAEFPKGIKIFATLSQSIRDSDVKIDMVVEVVPVKLSHGKISYEFQAA